jgi:hypothetical protein
VAATPRVEADGIAIREAVTLTSMAQSCRSTSFRPCNALLTKELEELFVYWADSIGLGDGESKGGGEKQDGLHEILIIIHH